MTLEKQELHLEEMKKRIRMANMIQQEANKLRILSSQLICCSQQPAKNQEGIPPGQTT